MGFSTGGVTDGMKKSLENNKNLKKKILYFNDKSKTKYKNNELKFKKGSQEEIDAFHAKFKREKKIRYIKKLIVLLISVSIILLILFFIQEIFK